MLLHLLEDGVIAFTGSTDGIAVGTKIYRGQHGVICFSHQDCFGGGGTDIKTQDACVCSLNVSGFDMLEFHLVCKIL